MCDSHHTKVFSNGKGAHYVTRGKKKKKSKEIQILVRVSFCPFCLIIHTWEASPFCAITPSHHHTYWMCVLYRGEQYFFHRKCKKQLCGELWRRETRWSDLSKGRVKLQTKLPWFILRLFVKHCCSAALTSSSALRPWQMQVSSVTRNQSSEKASQLIPAEGGSQPH